PTMRRRPGDADLECAPTLPSEAIHLDHIPVRLGSVNDTGREVLQDRAEVAHHLERWRHVAIAPHRRVNVAPRAAGEAQHRRRVRPPSWNQFDRTEAEPDDQIPTPHAGPV